MTDAPKLTTALLRRAYAAARKHFEVQALITAAMEARYGTTHSAVDCDPMIDTLDQGFGDPPTLADCDEAMAACGAHPIGSPSNV